MTRMFRATMFQLLLLALVGFVFLTAFAVRLQAAGEPLSAEALGAVFGLVAAVIFAYFPGLNTSYAALKTEYKSLIMIGVMAVVVGLVFAQACTSVHLLPWSSTCDQGGAETLIKTFVYAVGLNQTAHRLLPEAAAVKAAKAARPA